MKTRLLIIAIMTVLPLILPQGFSQCIYNDDWPDAPCFDTGPVSHMEFNKAWAPYHEHKGAEWMESKRIQLHQAIEQGIVEKWVKKLENHNVYQYYLSTNEIQSHLPYDAHTVKLDPNFKTRESMSYEDTCGSNFTSVDGVCMPDCGKEAKYVNGVCEIIKTESSHYVNTSPFYQALLMFSLFLWPFFVSGAAIFIVLAKTPRYKKSTRIVVTLFGSLVMAWFLIMMFIGIWPQMGA